MGNIFNSKLVSNIRRNISFVSQKRRQPIITFVYVFKHITTNFLLMMTFKWIKGHFILFYCLIVFNFLGSCLKKWQFWLYGGFLVRQFFLNLNLEVFQSRFWRKKCIQHPQKPLRHPKFPCLIVVTWIFKNSNHIPLRMCWKKLTFFEQNCHLISDYTHFF